MRWIITEDLVCGKFPKMSMVGENGEFDCYNEKITASAEILDYARFLDWEFEIRIDEDDEQVVLRGWCEEPKRGQLMLLHAVEEAYRNLLDNGSTLSFWRRNSRFKQFTF
jgi:hypothetical protein